MPNTVQLLGVFSSLLRGVLASVLFPAAVPPALADTHQGHPRSADEEPGSLSPCDLALAVAPFIGSGIGPKAVTRVLQLLILVFRHGW